MNRFTLTVGDMIIDCSEKLYEWMRDNIHSLAFEDEGRHWGLIQINSTLSDKE